jgi:hypothetical protein
LNDQNNVETALAGVIDAIAALAKLNGGKLTMQRID